MARNYILIDTTSYYGEGFKEDYKLYCDDCEDECETPISYDDWLIRERDNDIDDLLDNLRYCNIGRATITGSVGCWGGRYVINPIKCDNIEDAIRKCLRGEDDFRITVWKTKIMVEAWNHDSRFHGNDVFIIKTPEKRESMYLW